MTNDLQSGNDNQPGVPFALKALVVTLGVIMIVMLLVLIIMVVTKGDKKVSTGSGVAVEMSGGVAHIPIDLGATAKVRSTVMERGVLTIVIETDSGDRIVLFDVKENRVISILEFAPTP